jgi:hypothetical protein
LGKRTNHQLKPIHLADVYQQTELKIPNLHKAFFVVRHPKRHPTNIQASKNLPTRPNAPSQAHLQGTQSRHTKANLAKEPALCQRTANPPLRTEFLSASTKYISKLQD